MSGVVLFCDVCTIIKVTSGRVYTIVNGMQREKSK